MDLPSFFMSDMEISPHEFITIFSTREDTVMPKVGQVDLESRT